MMRKSRGKLGTQCGCYTGEENFSIHERGKRERKRNSVEENRELKI